MPSTGPKDCKASLLFVEKLEGSSEAEAVKWNLGEVHFAKVSSPAQPKRNADQKEDRFKALPELLPHWPGEVVPQSRAAHWLLIGLMAACWLVFPIGVLGV